MEWEQGLVIVPATRRGSRIGSSSLGQCRSRQAVIPILLIVILLNYTVSVEENAPAIGDVVYGVPQQIATLANQKIRESSGLAASRVERGLFWTHNDSGDEPRIFAFDAAGRDRGEFRIPKHKQVIGRIWHLC